MKIKFKPRHNHNHNDCWCDALAFALNKPYEEIYEMMKPFLVKDGKDEQGLNDLIMKGVLVSNGFSRWEVDTGEQLTVRKFFELYNSVDNHCVINTHEHTFYATSNTIYDNIDVEERGKTLDDLVDSFLLKPKEQA